MAEPMNITVGYDWSECANSAIEDLALAGIPAGSTVNVISVSEWFPFPAPDGGLAVISEGSLPSSADGERVAEIGAERLRALRPDLTVNAVGANGSAARQIVEYAEEQNSDLLVVGSHGRSALGRFFIGSISHQVLLGTTCHVRVARTGYPDRPADRPPLLIAAIDGSDYTPKVVKQILAREWPEGTKVILATSAEYSYDPEEERAGIDRLTNVHAAVSAEFREAGLLTESIIDTDKVHPTSLLLDLAEERKVDTIFLGARGLTGFARFVLGSISSSIALRAHCSVEVAR